MPTRCLSRMFDRPFRLVHAVVVGAVLSAVLPANAVDTLVFRRANSSQVVALTNTGMELYLPALALDTPVQLRVRTEGVSQRGRFEIAPSVLRGVAAAGIRAAGLSRQAMSARPTVTILAPTDLAAVPAGTLRVRGTVNANGDAVRVVVNGVRALVRLGTFTAAVRVTPDTMILTAVATTPQGVTACHQIGLSVSGTGENALRLRPVPGSGVVALAKRFSLLSGALPAYVKADPNSEGNGATPAANPGGLRFFFARVSSNYPPVYMTDGASNTGAGAMAFLLVPGILDEHEAGRERILTEKVRDVSVEQSRNVIIMNAWPELRGEPSAFAQRGSLPPGTPDVQPLLLGRSRDGELGDNFRGMRRGSEYSFGMLFIFDTQGFSRVRWY